MKVRFVCDSGANIHSAREQKFDTVKDFGIEDDEWLEMSDDEKFEMVSDWAHERLDIFWEDL